MKKSILLITILLCVATAPVFACTQVPTSPYNPVNTPVPFQGSEMLSERSSVIFTGRVLGSSMDTEFNTRVEVRVQRYLKGSGYDVIQIEYPPMISCGDGLVNGEAYVFFMEAPLNNAGIPRYSLPIFHFPIEAEAVVSAITGQSNPAQALPLDIQVTRIAESGDLNWLYIPLSILAALLGIVILALSLRRSRRKSKAKREELL